MNVDVYVSYTGDMECRKKVLRFIKALRQFSVPKHIEKNNIKYYIDPHDIVELNINRIQELDILKSCSYLLLFCETGTSDNERVKEQLQCFIEAKGISNVLTVLMSDSPTKSFPKELYQSYTFEYFSDEGEKITENKLAEPLAANIFGKSKKEISKKIQVEKLRILAQLYHVTFDDLRQRFKKNIVRKRIIKMAFFAVPFIILVSSLGIYYFQLSKRKNIEEERYQEVIGLMDYYYNTFPEMLITDEASAKYTNGVLADSLEGLIGLNEYKDLYEIGDLIYQVDFGETLKLNEYDSIDTARSKARILAYLNAYDEMEAFYREYRDLFAEEFVGDVADYTYKSELFYRKYVFEEYYEAYYISDIRSGPCSDIGLEIGDVIIGIYAEEEVNSVNYYMKDKVVQLIVLRLNNNGEFEIIKSKEITNVSNYKEMNIIIYGI